MCACAKWQIYGRTHLPFTKMADDKSGATGSTPETSIKRLDFKKQTLDDAYAVPANLLEIEVSNPETHGLARTRYTDYEVKMKASSSLLYPNNHCSLLYCLIRPIYLSSR